MKAQIEVDDPVAKSVTSGDDHLVAARAETHGQRQQWVQVAQGSERGDDDPLRHGTDRVG